MDGYAQMTLLPSLLIHRPNITNRHFNTSITLSKRLRRAQHKAQENLKSIFTVERPRYIRTILKNKAAIVELCESNAPSDLRRCSCTSQFTEIKDLLHEWYLETVRKSIYPNGPTLCEKKPEKQLNV